MQISWQIKGFIDGSKIIRQDDQEWTGGSLHIQTEFPEEIMLSEVQATLPVSVSSKERVFFNGYQSATHSPEYKRYAKMQGVKALHEAVIKKFSLDRAGDYHIHGYTGEKGVFHGYSWCYIREKDHYRLFASLDETPGYTIFEFDTVNSLMTIRRDCDALSVKKYNVFDLFYAEGTEDEVFDAWFEAMGVTPRSSETMCGYSTMYTHGTEIDAQKLRSDLGAAKGVLSQGDMILINLGWQDHIGDWNVNLDRFPDGMKKMVTEIHEAGYCAGIRLSPFVVSRGSSIFQMHPDWLLQVGGEPWQIGEGLSALDIDNSEVCAYLEVLFNNVFNEWGFDMVQVDKLYAVAPFGNHHETRAGRMIRAIDLLRDWCGGHLLSVMDTPLMPTFGKVDYCRVCNDVTFDDDDAFYMRGVNRERASTKLAMETMWTRRMLNRRAFMSDTDVFFLSNEQCKMEPKDLEKLALYEALTGGTWMISDPLNTYIPETIGHYERLRVFTKADKKRYVVGKHGDAVQYAIGEEKGTILL